MRKFVLNLLLFVYAAVCVSAQSYGPGMRLPGGLGASSISGDTAVIGNPHGNSVHVFTRSSGLGWVLQQTLTPSDGLPNEQFGDSAAISGDTIVVFSNKPAIYFFTRDDGVWTERQKVAVPSSSGPYGNKVGISGDTAVVGTTSDEGGKGAAHVFVRSGSTWSLQQKLIDPQAPAGTAMGNAVAISGDRIIVGAIFVGSIRIFERSGTAWNLVYTHRSGDVEFFPYYFGRYVAIDGDRAVVGATFDSGGKVVYFQRNGSGWVFAGSVFGGGLYGRAVAILQNTVVASSLIQTSSHPNFPPVWTGLAWANGQSLTTSNNSSMNPDHMSISGNNIVIGYHVFRLQNSAPATSIRGRVLSPSGGGVAGAVVHVMDHNDRRSAAVTNHSGYFRLSGINTGGPILLTVRSKRFQYETRQIDPAHDLNNLEITPTP